MNIRRIYTCGMTHSFLLLQCVAVCCSAWQHVAVCCSVLPCVAVRCSAVCIHVLSPWKRYLSCWAQWEAMEMRTPFAKYRELLVGAPRQTALRLLVWWLETGTRLLGSSCCSGMQCVELCCIVLQFVAVCCSVLVLGNWYTPPRFKLLQGVAPQRFKLLQGVAGCCSVLQCVAVCWK